MSERHSKFIFSILFLALHLTTYSQSYISSDTSLQYGTIKLSTPKENLYTVQFRENKISPFRRYHPDYISEYGFNGKIFVSKEVEINGKPENVFIEKIVDGTIKLYHLRGDGPKRFFVEKNDEGLLPVNKDLEAIRSVCENCEVIEDGLHLAKLNRRSLWYLVDGHNQASTKPFPRLRYGLTVGLSSRRLTIKGKQLASLQISQSSNDLVFDTHTGVDFGVLLDMPFKNPNFSLNTGLIFQGGKFERTIRSFLVRSEIDIQLHTYSIPLLIRFTHSGKRFRPYLNAGTQFSLHSTKTSKNNRTVFSADPIDPSTPASSTSIQERRFVAANMFGLVIGAGTEINLPGYRDLFAEYRLIGLTGSDPSTRMRYACLFVGIHL